MVEGQKKSLDVINMWRIWGGFFLGFLLSISYMYLVLYIINYGVNLYVYPQKRMIFFFSLKTFGTIRNFLESACLKFQALDIKWKKKILFIHLNYHR